MFKKTVAFVFAVGVLSYANADVVRIGIDEDFPPFSMPDTTGKYTGFDVDIAKALCETMKVECKMVYINWDEMLPALEHDMIDAVIDSVVVNKERKAKFEFTDMYINDPVRFVKKTTDNFKFNVASFKGKKIGVQQGNDENTTRALFGKVATIKAYPDVKEFYSDFLKGNLDFIVGSAAAIQFTFLNDYKKEYEFFGPNISRPTSIEFQKGAAIAVKKGDKELVNQFNIALATILKNGTYKKINDKYFRFNMHSE